VFQLLKFSILAAAVFWGYLFVATPKNLSDLAQKISQALPKPQEVGQAVAGALHAAPAARPEPAGPQNPPGRAAGTAEAPARQAGKIRVH
jgi:hypothetical protein